MATEREEELLRRIADAQFNSVNAYLLPDGGVAIVLSHRITMDEAVEIRVTDPNVRFYDWPQDAMALDRTNERGPWDGD